MRIRFIGLISHFMEPSGSGGFVVLPHADKHDARLIVPVRDIEGESDDNIDIQCFELGGRVASFPIIEALDRKGLLGVPELTKIGAGTAIVHPDVFTKTPNAVLNGFVNLPGGRYGIQDWFEFQGTFNGTDFTCMPCSVILDVRATVPVTVSGLASSLTLKQWATVTITNLESTITASGEFRNYRNLFQPPITTLISPSQTSAPKCPHGVQSTTIPRCPNKPLQVATVECSNSAYP